MKGFELNGFSAILSLLSTHILFVVSFLSCANILYIKLIFLSSYTSFTLSLMQLQRLMAIIAGAD